MPTSKAPKWWPMQKLVKKFRHCCYWCKKPVQIVKMPPFPPHAATRDHVIPKAFGGGNTQDNIVIACRRCNSRRGSSAAGWSGDAQPDL